MFTCYNDLQEQDPVARRSKLENCTQMLKPLCLCGKYISLPKKSCTFKYNYNEYIKQKTSDKIEYFIEHKCKQKN